MDEGNVVEGNGTIMKSISHPAKSELKYGLENFFFCTVIFKSFEYTGDTSLLAMGE
jgi:hypothetical protein